MKELYEKLSPELKRKFSKIKLLVLDFDGTLTDNKVYTNQEGIETVMADRGDGLGLEFVRRCEKIDVVILSKETNPVTAVRARKLKISCIHGLDSKLGDFKKAITDYGVSLDEVCYIGNDINDIECLKEAGIGVAVADSYPQVLEIADYVTQRKGGHGAVREVCELIMYAQGVHPFP